MTRVGQLLREKIVKQIKDGIEENASTFVISYSGMKASQIGEIRTNLKKAGVSMIVSKNSLARKALRDLDCEALTADLEKQTAFVVGNTDSVEISKLLIKIAEGNEAIKVKGGLQEGRALTYDDVKRLSDLPSKEVLFAQLLGTIQAPITRLMSAMNAKSRDLLSILKQYSEKKGGS